MNPDRLESLAKKRGLTVFARINFAKDAAAAGLAMLPTQLLILGSPAAGTALMLAAPGTALDLPLEVLAWQDPANRCWISYNTAEYLQQRHGFPAGLMANIAGLESSRRRLLHPDSRRIVISLKACSLIVCRGSEPARRASRC